MTDAPEAPAVADRLTTAPDRLDHLADEIAGFVADRVQSRDTTGVVVVLGGGVDPAVATILAVDALGPDRVFALLLPSYKHTEAETVTGELLVRGLGVDYETVQLLPFVHLFQELTVPDPGPPDDVGATTAAVDRMQTACAYYAAEVTDRLVLGTANRTDWLLGTVTKYGPRQGDILPLGTTYRTEVEALAGRLGIPEGLYAPGPPAPPGLQGVVKERSPATLDAVLVALVDEDVAIDRVAAEFDLDPTIVRAVAERHVASWPTRTMPPSPEATSDDRDGRFHELELRFD